MEVFIVEGIKLGRQQQLRLRGKVLLVFLLKNKRRGAGLKVLLIVILLFSLLLVSGKGTRKEKECSKDKLGA